MRPAAIIPAVVIVSAPMVNAKYVFVLVTMSTIKGMAISTRRKGLPKVELSSNWSLVASPARKHNAIASKFLAIEES
jgi:hypothetical protein